VWHSVGLDHWGRQLAAGGQEESRKPLCYGSASHDGEKRKGGAGEGWWSGGGGVQEEGRVSWVLYEV